MGNYTSKYQINADAAVKSFFHDTSASGSCLHTELKPGHFAVSRVNATKIGAYVFSPSHDDFVAF